MGENRGKQFEEQIRKGFTLVPDTHVLRLHDQMSGFKGSSNICDFVVYKYPYQYLIECKSCYGNTFPFSNITETQWQLADVDVPGVVAGYMIWFIDHDKTIFVQANVLKTLRESGMKSFNIVKPPKYGYIEVNGRKRKILFDYDLSSFFGWFNS